jgi:hypothetical protein
VVHSSKFPSEAGTKKSNEKHQQPLPIFHAGVVANIFWLSNGYGGMSITSIQQQTSRKLIVLFKIHKPTMGFCIVLPTEDRVNKPCLALKLGFVSTHMIPQELLRARHHPYQPTQNIV